MKKTLSICMAAFSVSFMAGASMQPAMAMIDWSGPHAGIVGGFGNAKADWSSITGDLTAGPPPGTLDGPLDHSFHIDMGHIGAVGGYDFDIANGWLLGLEGDFTKDFGSASTSPIVGTNTGLADEDSTETKMKWDGSVRARIGYAISPKVMLFGTAGWGIANVEFKTSCLAAGLGGDWCSATRNEAFSKTYNGWVAGAGADIALNERLSVRLEYRYSDYGSKDIAILSEAAADTVLANVDYKAQTVNVGLICRF